MRTGEFYPSLEVLDGNRALVEVDMVHGDAQSLADAAAKVEEETDKQFISEVLGCLFQFERLFRFKVGLSHDSSVPSVTTGTLIVHSNLALRAVASLLASLSTQATSLCGQTD